MLNYPEFINFLKDKLGPDWEDTIKSVLSLSGGYDDYEVRNWLQDMSVEDVIATLDDVYPSIDLQDLHDLSDFSPNAEASLATRQHQTWEDWLQEAKDFLSDDYKLQRELKHWARFMLEGGKAGGTDTMAILKSLSPVLRQRFLDQYWPEVVEDDMDLSSPIQNEEYRKYQDWDYLGRNLINRFREIYGPDWEKILPRVIAKKGGYKDPELDLTDLDPEELQELFNTILTEIGPGDITRPSLNEETRNYGLWDRDESPLDDWDWEQSLENIIGGVSGWRDYAKHLRLPAVLKQLMDQLEELQSSGTPLSPRQLEDEVLQALAGLPSKIQSLTGEDLSLREPLAEDILEHIGKRLNEEPRSYVGSFPEMDYPTNWPELIAMVKAANPRDWQQKLLDAVRKSGGEYVLPVAQDIEDLAANHPGMVQIILDQLYPNMRKRDIAKPSLNEEARAYAAGFGDNLENYLAKALGPDWRNIFADILAGAGGYKDLILEDLSPEELKEVVEENFPSTEWDNKVLGFLSLNSEYQDDEDLYDIVEELEDHYGPNWREILPDVMSEAGGYLDQPYVLSVLREALEKRGIDIEALNLLRLKKLIPKMLNSEPRTYAFPDPDSLDPHDFLGQDWLTYLKTLASQAGSSGGSKSRLEKFLRKLPQNLREEFLTEYWPDMEWDSINWDDISLNSETA